MSQFSENDIPTLAFIEKKQTSHPCDTGVFLFNFRRSIALGHGRWGEKGHFVGARKRFGSRAPGVDT
jgi:hypothetical protein